MIRVLKSCAAIVALGLAFGAFAQQAAAAPGYKTIAPLKGLCRSDISDPCTPYNLFGPPAISGDFVVWTNRMGAADGIWSYQISTRKIRKLAGFGTKAPGGAGKFTAFGYAGSDIPTALGGDTVVFFARDADNVLGVYTSSVRGGGVSRIVTAGTGVPGGGGRVFQNLLYASTNGKTVAFLGVDGNGVTGIFKANVDGTNLEPVIDAANTQLDARGPSGPAIGYYGLFTRPTVGKRFVQFYASGLFDPVSGANATFRESGGYVDLVDHMTKLQGGTTGQHVRTGVVSADERSADLAVAADEPGTGYQGLFKVDTVNRALAFVSTKDKVPGVAAKFFGFYGFGLDSSGLAFTANYLPPDGGNPTGVFFVASPGGEIVTVAKNGPSYYLPYVGDRSISNGVIAFTEGYNGVDTFYLATPK